MVDITKGIGLFNNSDYFEAHDFFENIWISAPAGERLFYQGMVQISVGCFHLISGNTRGAVSQYNKGKTKLSGFLPSYCGIDLTKLCYDVEVIIKYIESGKAEFCYTDMPRIEKVKSIS